MARRSLWVAISASALSTALIVDGWFDILTARPPERLESIILAVFVELPVAFISWIFASRAIRQSVSQAK